MFITAFTLWLAAVHGLELSAGLLFGTAFIDVVAWVGITSALEGWATGTTSDQEFWKEDNK